MNESKTNAENEGTTSEPAETTETTTTPTERQKRRAAREAAQQARAAVSAARAATRIAEKEAIQLAAAAKKKRLKRTAVTEIAQTCDTLESAAAQVHDAMVQDDLVLLKAARSMAERASSELVTARAAAARGKHIRADGRAALAPCVRSLQIGLCAIQGGADFVSRHKGTRPEVTARAIQSGLTPQILGHNQPLLTEMNRALDRYNQAEELWKASVALLAHDSAQNRVCQRRLALTVFTLDLALQRARAREEVAALSVPDLAAGAAAQPTKAPARKARTGVH